MKHNPRAAHCLNHTHWQEAKQTKSPPVAYEGHQVCYPCMVERLEGYAAKFRSEDQGGTLFAKWAQMYEQRAAEMRRLAERVSA